MTKAEAIKRLMDECCKSRLYCELYPDACMKEECEIYMAIEALKERPKGEWIPCSDCLPEEDGHYIVYAPSYRGGSSGGKEKHNGVMFSRFKNGKWSIEVGYHKRPGCVKAWMPLPDPWKGEENETANKEML